MSTSVITITIMITRTCIAVFNIAPDSDNSCLPVNKHQHNLSARENDSALVTTLNLATRVFLAQAVYACVHAVCLVLCN